jgi:hypothetical protein
MEKILDLQKRFYRKEKDIYLDAVEEKLTEYGYEYERIASGNIIKSVNLETKCDNPDYIFFAHYDTGTIAPLGYHFLMKLFGHKITIPISMLILISRSILIFAMSTIMPILIPALKSIFKLKFIMKFIPFILKSIFKLILNFIKPIFGLIPEPIFEKLKPILELIPAPTFEKPIPIIEEYIPILITIFLILLLFLLLISPSFFSNKKNLNDNTSGVVSLLLLAKKLKEKGINNVKFAFIDNAKSGF